MPAAWIAKESMQKDYLLGNIDSVNIPL